MKAYLIALAALATATPAAAQCVWKWDCTTGQCKQVPICQSAIDIVPPRPPEIRPIAPPTIRPIPQIGLPPLGTRQCNQRYICNNGWCEWRQVCQ